MTGSFQLVKKHNIKLQTAAKSSPSSRMESIFFDIHCSKLKENIDTTHHRDDSFCRYLRRSQSLNVNKPYSVNVKVLLLPRHRVNIKEDNLCLSTG